MPPVLTRQLKKRDKGKDVQGVRRAVRKFTGKSLPTGDLDYQRTFNDSMVLLVKDAQDEAVIAKSGVVGPHLMAALRRADAFDDYAKQLLEAYADEQKPKLVEPLQGWDSLDPSLWKALSLGRSKPYSFSDLGEYNPSAANKAINSDHAVYPAFAFDLGIDPDTGWNNLKARAYVLQVVGWREVEYVILDDRIYHGRSWRRWSRGGHLNHIHVSGVR